MEQAKAIGTINVISDAICPWCYIGKRQLERALDLLETHHLKFAVSWHPFQLNPEMPRSLASCYRMLVEHLDLIADAYGRRGESQRLASKMRAKLGSADIERIFASGLHEFIQGFIAENNALGAAISEQYLV